MPMSPPPRHADDDRPIARVVQLPLTSTPPTSLPPPTSPTPTSRGLAMASGSWALRLAVAAAVAVLGAVALGPRLVRSDLPTDPTLLGTPARGVVKADRDYALVDDTSTDEHRAQSALASLPVWDLNDRARYRDAQIIQKALVRTAVAIEAYRRQAGDAQRANDAVPLLKGFDEVRAVVAGELAAAELEAPRDDEWAAIFLVLWWAPGAADVLGTAVSTALAEPMVHSPPGGPLDQAGQLRVRGVQSGDELTVDVADVQDLAQGQKRLEAAIIESISGIAPTTTPPGWGVAVSRVASWLSSHLTPNLTWNAAETEYRRQGAAARVAPVIIRAYRGEIVLRPGEIITPRHQLLSRAMAIQQADDLRTRATVGTGFFVALVCAVVYLFGARRVFQRRLRNRDVLFLGVLMVMELGLLVAADVASARIVSVLPYAQAGMLTFALPVAFGPMCVRLTLPPDVALLFALVVALLGGVVVEGGMVWAVTATLSSMTAVALVTGGPRRFTLLLSGLAAGVVAAFAALTLELFRGALTGASLGMLLAACVAGGVGSGAVALIFVPIVERLFGYLTEQRLYRLADLNSALLKDLIVHAPGTWHHSVRVAVLAEQAAAVVGANPLLARVMSLYHDIGKIARPQSFRENQSGGEDPHDRLSPEESASMLRGHVEEGLALAREHGLPAAVAAVIDEHHADSVMESFLEKARARARDSGHDESIVDDRLFRYSGRRPHSKESALVLLADQIESASRNLGDNTSDEACGDLVDGFVNRALTSDVLAGCELSLRDLERARAALKASLVGLLRGDVERTRS
jgi:putative nucleotidyltransferase with HDIG domain